ncbi:hypothetical protein ACHWQZ_G002579 [Mnemiopsis leidyi]
MNYSKENTTHRATVCGSSKKFNFALADYFCQLLGYEICVEWGRTEDTNNDVVKLQQSLEKANYKISQCMLKSETIINCEMENDISICSHTNDVWLNCGNEKDAKSWRDDGKCGTDYPLRSGEPSQCNPTGEKPCCNGNLKDCGNTKEYCVCDKCRDYRPINNKECEISEVERFLKYRCSNQKLQDHFKCALSDTRYKPSLKTWEESRGVFMLTTTSEVCEKDPFVYQACGFGTLITAEQKVDALCGGNFSSVSADDENGQYKYNEIYKPENSSGECDGICNNGNTNSDSCRDESYCGGFSYGRKCSRLGEVAYAPVHWICNDVKGCDDNSDEEDCDELELGKEYCTHYKAKYIFGEDITVPIHNFTRCAIFDISKGIFPYCIDFFDQTDCDDTDRIGGFCEIEGKKRSISKNMVCYHFKANNQKKFCDDGSENFCEHFSFDSEDCIVHRHKMCDKSPDCRNGIDELTDDCKLMTTGFLCQRKFGKYKKRNEIPVSWLLDEKEDCENDEDEETSKWRECLPELNQTRYVIPRTERVGCKDVFKCNLSTYSVSVRLDIMCDGVESCGQKRQVEHEVCKFSRDFPDLKKIAPTISINNDEVTDLCTGLVDGPRDECEQQEFLRKDKIKAFGLTKWLNIPKSRVNCQDTFGEFYVYLSCMDRCKDATCPIGDTLLKYNSCPGQYPDRVYTLAGEKGLTFVTKSNGKTYKNDYFQCQNKRCVEFSQVCDLTNDCGDWSDEANCVNSILCGNNKSRISLKQRCDGLIDCYDLSDECNEHCGKQILGNLSISVICWLMGILATILNFIFIIRTAYSLKLVRTGNMLETKLLIMTIALGDLLNGIYLIAIATYDAIIGSAYCQYQAKWLSSSTCSALGVISTIGSQTSLFAMTVLAVTRYIGLTKSSMKTPSHVTKRAIFKTSVKIAIILASSAAIAFVPLVPSFENYFVEGIYYGSENNVFIGFPNKERHVNVLNAYHGDRNTSYDLPWEEIHKNVALMFTNKHETITWQNVHYYGNDGHCLFKFFIRNDDARRSRQSFQEKTEVVEIINFEGNGLLWCVLTVNFICFLVMSTSYIRITIQTWKSSSSSGQNSNLENVRRKEKIEQKISLIIATDFICWIPFLVVCALHNFQFIDATNWYVYVAMVLLPVNSVLNPLLYDDTISGFLAPTSRKVSTRLYSFASTIYSRTSEILPQSKKREEVAPDEHKQDSPQQCCSVSMDEKATTNV